MEWSKHTDTDQIHFKNFLLRLSDTLRIRWFIKYNLQNFVSQFENILEILIRCRFPSERNGVKKIENSIRVVSDAKGHLWPEPNRSRICVGTSKGAWGCAGWRARSSVHGPWTRRRRLWAWRPTRRPATAATRPAPSLAVARTRPHPASTWIWHPAGMTCVINIFRHRRPARRPRPPPTIIIIIITISVISIASNSNSVITAVSCCSPSGRAKLSASGYFRYTARRWARETDEDDPRGDPPANRRSSRESHIMKSWNRGNLKETIKIIDTINISISIFINILKYQVSKENSLRGIKLLHKQWVKTVSFVVRLDQHSKRFILLNW